MKAILLAAGFGTRLLPLTRTRSKVALSLAGVPVLVRVMRTLRGLGVDEFVVNLHHLPATVRSCLEAWGERAVFTFEKEILGTGGALYGARDQLAGGTFLLVNGDCLYAGFDLAGALEFHRKKGALATLVLLDMPAGGGYRGVETDRMGRVLAIAGRPAGQSSTAAASLHFPGLHVIEPEFLDLVGPGFSDINAGLYPPLIAQGAPIYGYHTRFRWFDLGSPARFLEAAGVLLEEESRSLARGAVLIGENSRIHPEARLEPPVEIGREATIGPGCRLRRAVLGDRVRLEENVTVEESLIGDDVSLSAGTRLERCVAAQVNGSLEIKPWS